MEETCRKRICMCEVNSVRACMLRFDCSLCIHTYIHTHTQRTMYAQEGRENKRERTGRRGKRDWQTERRQKEKRRKTEKKRRRRPDREPDTTDTTKRREPHPSHVENVCVCIYLYIYIYILSLVIFLLESVVVSVRLFFSSPERCRNGGTKEHADDN